MPLWRTRDGAVHGRLDAPLISHPFAKQSLVKSILKFYVEVEQTGMSSQFYDKFNIRYNISQILKAIWTHEMHISQIIKISRDSDFFVRFVNLLMNDTTFLLDESLSKLKEIGTIQQEILNGSQGTELQELQGRLAAAERQATSYMSLGNETVDMLAYLTRNPEIVGPFVSPDIVSRLAPMLDHNLKELVGARCAELKVRNPEKYRFNPKKLLSKLIDIFLHLAHRQEFVQAVARDGRSYSREIFSRAANILLQHRLKQDDEITKLKHFVNEVETSLQSEMALEEALGEAPDEFLGRFYLSDPLLFTVMEEPVTLPSGINIDLSTIRSHLLSSQHDPVQNFNNSLIGSH